jgi:hypothetical protein
MDAANRHMNDVAHLILQLNEKRGDSGATKAERLLDQLRGFDAETIQRWPVEPLVMGLVNIADELAKDDAGDDWGYPRIWHVASSLLKRLLKGLPDQRWNDLAERIFAEGQSLGFLSHLLRNETFSHGFYGDRPDTAAAATTPDTFDRIRKIMLQRYGRVGLDRIMGERDAITILYAWSQAGGRDDLVRAVAEYTAEDDAFVMFMLKICTSSVSTSGANLSLSLDAIHNFFASPAEEVRRLRALEANIPPVPGAGLVLAAIERSIHFEGLKVEQALEAWQATGK